MKNIVTLILFFFVLKNNAQSIVVSNIISENKITSFSEQKLIIIDFWATWCAPCVAATRQLEILQNQNKDKVFVISISDEHSSKISKYLENKPIELMVTSDSDNYTFSKYQIQSRPSAVLLDLEGNLLWKGHPSDITQQKLDEFYLKQINAISLKDLTAIMQIKNDDYVPIETKENKIYIEKYDQDIDEFVITNDQITYYGSISNLYFIIKNNYPFELLFDNSIDDRIKLSCSLEKWNKDKDRILKKVLSEFDLKEITFEKQIEAFEFNLQNDNLLWDSNQFDWEGSPTNYLEGIDRLQADNVTITTLTKILSRIKNQNYIYKGNNQKIYDWDFQFLYDDLMIEELDSSFGILLSPIKYNATITEIKKK